MKRYALLPLCIALVCGFAEALENRRAEKGPEALLSEYFSALRLGEWPRAESCWFADEVAHSERLGISYPGSHLKVDCASPVVTNLDEINSGQVDVRITNTDQTAESANLTVRLVSSRDTLETGYYAVRSNGDWKLVSKLTALTRSWHRLETEYATVHFTDSTLINDFALNALDATTERLLDLLEIPDSRRRVLSREKIDYFICSKSDFELLTGYDAHGVTDFQSDAVIARHLPHAHELAHLMMNYALQDAPLHTLPFMQEGFAVAVGGRWGKTPDVIKQLGHFLLSGGVCNLEDLITYDGFHHKIGMPDISYPAAGILVSLLLDRCGVNGFETLYRELSGSNGEIRSLTVEAVKADLQRSTGWSWDELLSKVGSFSSRFESSGIDPGSIEFTDSPVIDLQSGDLTMSIWGIGEEYYIKIRSANGSPCGVLLLADDESQMRPSYRSWMFAEQLPAEEYGGEIYGICFDVNEVGLYNYYLNLLTSKFISMFAPQSSYWDEDDSTISFSIRKSLIEREITDYKLTLVPEGEE